jgi:hypothetical protein
MSSEKFQAIAEALKGVEDSSLNEVKELLKKYDKLNDKRFEAFDIVIQQQMDILEDVAKKVTAFKIPEFKVDNKDIVSTLDNVSSKLRAEIRILQEKKVEKFEMPVIDFKGIEQRIDALEKENKAMRELLNKLITAKRVPEYDTFGNVVAVRLEI